MPENRNHSFVHHWLPVIVYCAAIFVQSCFPSPEAIPGIWNLDKVVHFVAYGILGVLFYRALKSGPLGRREGLVLLLAILFTGLYGASDELHQHFVPTRSADGWDLLADFLGGVAGAFFAQKLFEWNSKIREIRAAEH